MSASVLKTAHERIFELLLFAILGTLMFVSKVALEALPNIHPVSMLTAVYTLVYRRKALLPLYLYVCLNGIYAGFSVWWIPYLYIWLPLWLLLMLIPQHWRMSIRAGLALAVTVLHGIAFGLLYAPFWAVYANLDGAATLAWIVSGFPYDLLHAGGNAVIGLLIWPLARALEKLKRKYS